MKVLGITGGVGSGKSEVLRWLKEAYGAYVCQMDETAKELQKKGTGNWTGRSFPGSFFLTRKNLRR